jgi:cyanophycinase
MIKLSLHQFWIQRMSVRTFRSFGFKSSALIILVAASPTSVALETTGPETGTLVIVGGGDRENIVFKHFVELAGGKDANIVFVPTASSSNPDYEYMQDRSAAFARKKLGMTNVTVVHTHDPAEADTEEFVRPIRQADAVWFSGGRQWRITDAYLGTRTEREFRAVLDRGGVIGGSSAGATIQGSFLVRGDTSGSSVLIGDHQVGFGYIKNSAIDQHVIPRRRQNGLIEVLTDPGEKLDPAIDSRELLGIGIDEATGIVVRENKFTVVGKEDGVVLLYDARTWKPDTADRDKYVELWRGARYNLKERIVIDRGTRPHPKSTPATTAD